MRKIVDVNYLTDSRIEEFLRADKLNVIVLTDFACMECYKGNSLHNIARRVEIISQFPFQVAILKSTREAIQLGPAMASDPDTVVDKMQTEGFANFCRLIRRAVDGDRSLTSRVLELGAKANAQLESVKADAAKLVAGIEVMANAFDPADLRALRNGSPLSSEAADRAVRQMLFLAARLLQEYVGPNALPDAAAARSTYLFRLAICVSLLSIRWVSLGGIAVARRSLVANDAVDMTYAAYATFFDGLLTNDSRLLGTHDDTVWFLEHVFPLTSSS